MFVSQKLIATDRPSLAGTLDDWRRRWPELGVVAFLPEAEKEAVATLQAVCRERGIALAGAIFPALMADAEFLQQGACLLAFDPMPPCFLAEVGKGANPLVGATRGLLAGLPAGGEAPTLFLIFDGMLPDISTLLAKLHMAFASGVKYAGVNAGSETFQPMPCLFDGQRVLADGALGLLLPAATEVVVRHGYPVSKALLRATSAGGNRIDRIDNRPAFTVYQEVIKAEYGVELTHENFYDHAVHFPFGVVTALDVLVRIPVAFDADGSLFCVGEVPPNTLLRLLRAPTLEDNRCVEELAAGLGPVTGRLRGRPLLNFYCAGRRLHFGCDAGREIASLKAATGVAGVFGAVTLGEIDQLEDLGFPRFHNACLVSVALP